LLFLNTKLGRGWSVTCIKYDCGEYLCWVGMVEVEWQAPSIPSCRSVHSGRSSELDVLDRAWRPGLHLEVSKRLI
jgi:hypothetical protein